MKIYTKSRFDHKILSFEYPEVNGRTLIWERNPPVKKMTQKDIEKELGYKIEIVEK